MARHKRRRGGRRERREPPRTLLIVNPRSGTGIHRERLDAVRASFAKRGRPLDLRYTEGPGHATELARRAAAEGYAVVIGAGGDGTINEVLNGLVGSPTKLGILPWGTGNVFTREMQFPSTVKGLCKTIIRGTSLRLDVGKCGDRHFLLMCGAGFDAYSLRQIEGLGLKKKAGMAAYALGGLRAFGRYRFPEMRAVLPDGEEISCSYALVSNTSLYGAFFRVSPRAVPTDGLLDLFAYKGKGRFAFLRLAARILLTALSPRPLALPSSFLREVAVRRVSSVRLEAQGGVPTQIDGDLGLPLPAEISVLPAAVDCILPARAVRRLKKGSAGALL